MAAPDPSAFWQALASLAPLVGGGGISAIIVAFLGYRQSVQRGGKPAAVPPEATLAIGALYADRDVLERIAVIGNKIADGLTLLSDRVDHLGVQVERGRDDVRELRRAIEDQR